MQHNFSQESFTNIGDELYEEQYFKWIGGQMGQEEVQPFSEEMIQQTKEKNNEQEAITESAEINNIATNLGNRTNATNYINLDPRNALTTGHLGTTAYTGKKRGRKGKNDTEKGDHTKDDKDDIEEKDWRFIMNTARETINSINKYKDIKKTNFIQQFGCYKQQIDFLKLRLYQYFCYNTIFEDQENHREIGIGTKNMEIIRKMVFEEKDELFIAVMKLTIEEFFEKFIKNDKTMKINGVTNILKNFKTLDDAIKTKEKELIEENLSQKEIDAYLIDYKNRLFNLVNFIYTDGQKIKRKSNYVGMNPIIIQELEEN